MTALAYYSENDPYAARWLHNLIDAGHIAPGCVDDRSIIDVDAGDLRGFRQCHFFAGIGVWSYALRLAGWPDDRPVWTGSCPCQPFSAAGKGEGHEDSRHLWPTWQRLIGKCKPATIFGEQVASADGLAWLDAVLSDLEGDSYAVAAMDFPAAGIGAAHIRHRLWFVADRNLADGSRRLGLADIQGLAQCERQRGIPSQACADVGARQAAIGAGVYADTSSLDFPASGGRERFGDQPAHQQSVQANAITGFWDACDWIACRDGKRRPVEPGTFPLAHGIANRVGRLRAYGNAIVPQAAAAVIRAFMAYAP
jgi:DNA (cytosine-5)-methyltransferase 1